MDAAPGALTKAVAVLEGGFSGRLGFWALDLQTGRGFGHRSQDVFPAASTIKLFVLRELFRRAEAGELDLDRDTVTMRHADRTRGSGVIHDLSDGLTLSLRDAATLMVTVSDNTCTNLLVARLGTRRVNATARRDGFDATHLHGLLFKGLGIRNSVTSPADLGRLMTRIAEGEVDGARAMLDILDREQSANVVGRLIPYDPYASGRARWRIASKSGSIRGVRNDVAYVRGPGARYVLAVMSDGCADERFSVDNEGTLATARLAAAVHDQITAGAGHDRGSVG